MSEEDEIIKDLAQANTQLTLKLAKARQALQWIVNFGNDRDLKRLAESTLKEIE